MTCRPAKAAGFAEFRRQLVDSTVRRNAHRMVIEGPFEDHLLARRWLRKGRGRPARRTSGPAPSTYQLRATETCRGLIVEIGKAFEIRRAI